MREKFKKFFSKKVLIGLGVLVLIIIILVVRNGGQKGEQAIVARHDIVEKVAATGKVKPAQSVELGFDKSGRIAAVYAKVGDKVARGAVIASLEAGESSAELQKARATLLEEQIKLRELKSTAPLSYNDAVKSLDAAIKDAFVSADNAVRNKADQFFKNSPENPEFTISITSGNFIHYFNVPSDTKLELRNDRKQSEEVLINWQKRISAPKNIEDEAERSIQDLNLILNFLDEVAYAVNSFTPAEYAYETTVAGYKTDISTARNAVSTSISALVTAQNKLNSAPTLGEGGQFENVLIQEAKVAGAQANVSSLESALGKTAIRAPFGGVITKQDAKLGEAVSVGEALISVMSESDMYIEANISEIHIGKVKALNPVAITFDAFPGETFAGVLSYVEPGDVEIDGVVNYKVRVNLVNPDSRIKSGLTSNLKIETSKKENVLALPAYSIIKEGGQNFVNVLENKKIKKVPVNLGTQSDDGFVEILGGVPEGTVVQF